MDYEISPDFLLPWRRIDNTLFLCLGALKWQSAPLCCCVSSAVCLSQTDQTLQTEYVASEWKLLHLTVCRPAPAVHTRDNVWHVMCSFLRINKLKQAALHTLPYRVIQCCSNESENPEIIFAHLVPSSQIDWVFWMGFCLNVWSKVLATLGSRERFPVNRKYAFY